MAEGGDAGRSTILLQIPLLSDSNADSITRIFFDADSLTKILLIHIPLLNDSHADSFTEG